MRTASASQNIWIETTAKAHHNITTHCRDNFWGVHGKTPEPQSSSKANDRDMMMEYPGRRRHTEFTAEQMHVMTQIP